MDKVWPVNSSRSIRDFNTGEDSSTFSDKRMMNVAPDHVDAQVATKTALAFPERHDSKQKLSEMREISILELQKDNTLLRRDLSKGRNEYAKLLEDVNKLTAELQSTNQELQSTRQKLGHALSYSSKTLLNENAKLKYALDDANERLRVSESKVRTGGNQLRRVEEETRMNMQSLVEENERLQEQARDDEEYMNQLLHNAMKDGKWVPLPDETIRDRLDRVHSDTKDWAKRWACETFSLTHLPPERATEVRKAFSRFVHCERDGSLSATVEVPTPKMRPKMASLLLTGALAHLLEVEFFANPFFCINPSQSQIIRDVYRDLIEANFQQAHSWRSEAWRILNPPHTVSMTKQDEMVSQETSRHLRTLCDHIVNDFLLSPASMLLTPLSDDVAMHDREKALKEILLKAAEVATSLWTQRSFTQCMNMTQFSEKQVYFSVTNPLMTAHPLNKVDPEDTSNNSRGILIVTRPSILAFDGDDQRGMKGDSYRVLAKAIVWLEEPKKSGFLR